MDKRKKVLIIRLGAIGDVVQTTVIANAIKNKHPEYEIHYLTQEEIAPILKNNPNIDKIITWNYKNRKSLKQLFSTGIKLYKEHYDIVFNLTYAIRNFILSIMCFSKKIVVRKYSGTSWVEDFFLTAKSVIKDIECPNRLYLGVSSDIKQKLEKELGQYPRPYIFIIPAGGTDRSRQGRIWNIENWKILIKKLQEIYGGTVFVCGSKSERNYHEKLNGENIVICSGNYSIEESSALFSLSDLMISGDTGPIHIASGHNIKTLALFGSTSPDKTKPYGENGYYISADTDCKYCWQKKCRKMNEGGKYTPCMEKITPEMVLDKIKSEQLL